MGKLQELFSDGKHLSSMRVMAMLSLIAAISIAIAGLALDRDLSSVAELCAVFVGAAFAGKAAQAHIESKEVEK